MEDRKSKGNSREGKGQRTCTTRLRTGLAALGAKSRRGLANAKAKVAIRRGEISERTDVRLPRHGGTCRELGRVDVQEGLATWDSGGLAVRAMKGCEWYRGKGSAPTSTLRLCGCCVSQE